MTLVADLFLAVILAGAILWRGKLPFRVRVVLVLLALLALLLTLLSGTGVL